MKFWRALSLFLFLFSILCATSCSHSLPEHPSARLPAQNPHLESADLQSYYKIQEQLTEGLSRSRKIEVEIISDNTAKFFLYAIGKNQEEKNAIFQQAKLYLQMELQKLAANIEMEQKGAANPLFYKFSHPPMWTLEDEVDFLVEQVNRNEHDFALFSAQNFKDIHDALFDIMSASQSKKPSHLLTLSILDQLSKGNYAAEEFFQQGKAIYFRQKKKLLSQVDKFIQGGEFEFGDKKIAAFVKAFLGHYFMEMPEPQFKTIVSEFLNLGASATKDDVLGVIFRNCGPGLGKLLQQLGKENGVGDEFKPIMEMLESNGKIVPYHLVQKLVNADGGFEFNTISEEPLGTGTMAQVHKALLKQGSDEEIVALRFLKPKIEERVRSDIQILKRFVAKIKDDKELAKLELSNFDKLVESSRDFLMMELDIQGTIDRQEMAFGLYNRAIKVKVGNAKHVVDFKVPRIYRGLRPDSKLHVQEYVVFGDKFSKMSNPAKQKAVSRGLFRLWFEEAVFRSGFMHADLHQGNFTVTLADDGKNVIVHIFDYGLGEVLPQEVRRGFILIGLGDNMKSAKVITDGIFAANLGELKLPRAQVLKMVEKAIASGEVSGTEQWVSWLLKEGMMVNDRIGTLARGGMLISQLPKLVGDQDMIFNEQLKMGVREYFHALADRDVDFPLHFSDGLMLGSGYFRNSCIRLLRSLRSVFPRK